MRYPCAAGTARLVRQFCQRTASENNIAVRQGVPYAFDLLFCQRIVGEHQRAQAEHSHKRQLRADVIV